MLLRFQRGGRLEEGALLPYQHSLEEFYRRYGVELGPGRVMTARDLRELIRRTIDRISERLTDEASRQILRGLISLQNAIDRVNERVLDIEYYVFLLVSLAYAYLFEEWDYRH